MGFSEQIADVGMSDEVKIQTFHMKSSPERSPPGLLEHRMDSEELPPPGTHSTVRQNSLGKEVTPFDPMTNLDEFGASDERIIAGFELERNGTDRSEKKGDGNGSEMDSE